MMTNITVKDLAKMVNNTTEQLLTQFKKAGIDITDVEQIVSGEQKQALLKYFRDGEKKMVMAPKTITLKRKSTSQMQARGSTSKRTINVEVRKKRTYVKQITSLAEERAQAEQVAIEKAAAEAEAKRLREIAAQTEREAKQQREQQAKAASVNPSSTAAEVARSDKKKATQTTDDAERREKKKKSIKSRKAQLHTERRTVKNPLAALDDEGEWLRNRRSKTMKSSTLTEHNFALPTTAVVHEVVIPETITVAQLAQKMSIKGAEVVKKMMQLGAMVTINQAIDQDTAVIVVEELGHKPKPIKENALEEEVTTIKVSATSMQPRPPVVTIMGHVDHGKTSLLDYIRRTKVTADEAGGITQHIGAYHVDTDRGSITFLDTPGHAAFTAMRARGAQCTDIVVLIVAADDGVKPQTIEAIQHAKAAQVPIIVAVNKMDKGDADAERVKNELGQYDVIPEDWGGDTMFVSVSAKTGQGVDELLDVILLQAEVLELKAVNTGPAQGVIIESRLDKGRGPVATVLVQQGLLEKSDVLLAGMEYGSIRLLIDNTGKSVTSALPSIPVQVLGLSGTANAGEAAIVVQNERKAREVALFRQGKFRQVKLARQRAAKLDNLFQQVSAANKTATLNIVLKADMQGSAEALREALLKLSTDSVKVNIVASGIGGINESDVNLAIASQAIIIGFNVRADATARRLVKAETVDLHYYSVIYDVIDEVKRALTGMLKPEFKQEIVGLAEVRDVFRSAKFGTVAGCMVIEGTIKRNNPIRVLRDNVVIYEGELESLKRFKEDVGEVRSGMECGIGVRDYNDVKVDDQIEVFEKVEVKREL